MRLTYLDEAGISPDQGTLVVSGPLIHGDTQLDAIENHLGYLTFKHIPHADRAGFIFHATDIWSGKGYFKDRNQWSLEKRLAILDDLIAVPSKFEIPVAYGAVDWRKITFDILKPGAVQHDLYVAAHTIAFGHCCMGLDKFMRKAFPGEITILVAEDRDSVRKSLKEIIATFRNPRAVQELGLDADFFPFKKIKDTVHFAKKDECRLLQLADTCTFVIRQHLLKNKHNPRFWNVLKPNLIWHLGKAPF